MTPRRFLSTHSGKAVLYIGLAGIVLNVPDALLFIAAGLLVAAGVYELRTAFRLIEAKEGTEQFPIITGKSLPNHLTELARTNGTSLRRSP